MTSRAGGGTQSASTDVASAAGSPVLKPDYDSKCHSLEVPHVLVVPIGFLIGPAARWMYSSLVDEPS